LLLMVEGRSAEALKTFATALLEHGGDPSQIEAIAMDMSPAYVKGATEYFPGARIVFDKFHVMVLAGAALDQVRYELQREGADLKGACGACAATSGTSVRIVKSNAKISVVSTPNLAVR
jgi:transposase